MKPRERKGILERRKDVRGRTYFLGKIYMQGRSDPKGIVRVTIREDRRYDEERARHHLAFLQEQEDLHGTLRKAKEEGGAGKAPACRPGEESVRAWFGRFCDACEARGQRAVKDRRGRFKKWIDPLIGDLPMTAPTPVLREAVRRCVAHLDAQIAARATWYQHGGAEDEDREGLKPGLSPKTAANVWGELTSAFAEACTSKDPLLRVREPGENPTRDVQAPDGGGDREQAALYPNEVLALLSCEAVPLYRRELYAVALYAGLRAGELRGLVPGDVDLEHDVINVRRQRKARGAATKTKTRAGVRQVPVHPRLRPLLELLVARAKVDHARRATIDPDAKPGPLVHVPPEEDCAMLARLDLLKAGCAREELHRDDEHRQHFTFHGLRHTAITHWAVGGLPLPELMAAAGHTDYQTTQRYVDLGAILRGQRFGEPHPPLPASLLQSTSESTPLGAPPKRIPRKSKRARSPRPCPSSHGAVLATPAGIEPALPA